MRKWQCGRTLSKVWPEFLIDYCYFIKETISQIFWRLFPTNFTWSILENFVPFCLEFLWNCRGGNLKIFCLSIYCTQCTKNEVFHQRFFCRKLRICLHLMKKPSVENNFLCSGRSEKFFDIYNRMSLLFHQDFFEQFFITISIWIFKIYIWLKPKIDLLPGWQLKVQGKCIENVNK